MTSSPIDLARVVDELSANRRAGIVETPSTLTVHGLDANDMGRIAQTIHNLGWQSELVDDANEVTPIDALSSAFGPFRISITKPLEDGILRVISLDGFRQLLSTESNAVWQIASARLRFSSELSTFQPWGQSVIFAPSPATKSPLTFVREAAEHRSVPSDIRRWLPRNDISEDLWNDPTFRVFADLAAPNLIYALSTELISKDTVVFVGPPKLRLSLSSASILDELSRVGFNNLRLATSWVYESSQDAEQRHGLLGAEIARSAAQNEPIGEVLKRSGSAALDSARLAYQLSLSEIGREAIKAQADLRKAVADDTAKLIENARGVATATVLAISTAIGLVAARLASNTPGWILASVSIMVAVYMISIVASGFYYLRLQRDVRAQWRQRLYRFVPQEDYDAMVENPAARSERIFYISAAIGIVIAVIAFLLGLRFWFAPSQADHIIPRFFDVISQA